MKTNCSLPYTLLLFIILTTQLAYSQHEFASIGAKWFINSEITNFEESHPLEDFFILESELDTVINDLSYRKVGDYLFHQDGHQIYHLWADSLRLIYDFELETGDTVRYEMLSCNGEDIVENTFEVTEVSFVNINGLELKKVTCELIAGYLAYNAAPYVYLEKIGSLRKPMEDLADCGLIPGAAS